MSPEQKARKTIDRQLTECGWLVQDYRDIYIAVGLGVAIHMGSHRVKGIFMGRHFPAA